MAALVPIFMLTAALLLAWTTAQRRVKRLRAAPTAASAAQPKLLLHAINDERCTGCETCITACPTNVLALVSHRSFPVRFDQCVQCEKCMRVCPTNALVMHREDVEPPTIKVPEIDANFQTAVPGQYLIGEAAAKPLVKNGANLGRLVVEHMVLDGLTPSGEEHLFDVVIVGSGPGGLSAALTCRRRGLRAVVVEKERKIAATIRSYPRGKTFMAEPADCRNLSFLPVYDTSKEELLETWQQLISDVSLDVRFGIGADSVEAQQDGTFIVGAGEHKLRTQRVVLATGVRGKPRTLGVPGEDSENVHMRLDDPADYRGCNVLVVGGGDTAIEAANAIAAEGGTVILSYRRDAFARAKKANIDKLHVHVAAGVATLMLKSDLRAIEPGSVTVERGGENHVLPNDHVFVLIGNEAPVRWLERVGVQMVERPHSYRTGASDELIEAMLGPCNECPTAAAEAAARVVGSRRRASQRSLARGTMPAPVCAADRNRTAVMATLPKPDGARAPRPSPPKAAPRLPPPIPHGASSAQRPPPLPSHLRPRPRRLASSPPR